MLRRFFIVILFCIGTRFGYAQHANYTMESSVRGVVVDEETKNPIADASITVRNLNYTNTVRSDKNGEFFMERIPIGKLWIDASHVGYVKKSLSNIELNTGRSLYTKITMEAVKQDLSTVVVKTNEHAVKNKMGIIGARTFSKADAERYAGALNDPARMAQNFAGVASAGDFRNDIVVRGNSSYGLLWNIDGVTVANPNHFGSKGSSGGAITILNSNQLSNSDFYTGNFPAQYGNAYSGVFDLSLRKGNARKNEYTFQAGWNGIEVGMEGPLVKNKPASFMGSYRYSNGIVYKLLDISLGVSGVPAYQDVSLKFDIPTQRFGVFNIVLIGGLSSINIERGAIGQTPYEALWDIKTTNNKFIGLLKNHYTIDKKSSVNSFISYSIDQNTNYLDSPFVNNTRFIYGRTHETDQTLTIGSSYNRKIGIRSFLELGYKITQNSISYHDSVLRSMNANGPVYYTFNNVSKDAIYQSEAYAQLRYSIGSKSTIYGGLRYNYLHSNNTFSIEPRLSFKTKIERSELGVGYSLVSKALPFIAYYNIDSLTNTMQNLDLKFIKSHQFDISWEHPLPHNFRIKTELYFQYLYNIPVESTPSWYSMANFGADYYQSIPSKLVNKGFAKNYGVEITLEKFFAQNWYVLNTLTLYRSFYYSDKWRSSQFDKIYLYNLLGGYDLKLKNNYTLLFNLKLTTSGGSPVKAYNADGTVNGNQTFVDRADAYFRTDLKVGLKKNKRKITHEFAVELDNLTGHQNEYLRYFNEKTQMSQVTYQMGRVPVVFYRLSF